MTSLKKLKTCDGEHNYFLFSINFTLLKGLNEGVKKAPSFIHFRRRKSLNLWGHNHFLFSLNFALIEGARKGETETPSLIQKSLKLMMGAQPFWILFDAAVIENWKRHIISQKREKLSLRTKKRWIIFIVRHPLAKNHMLSVGSTKGICFQQQR